MTGDSSIAKLVERQMRNWEITRQQRLELEARQQAQQVADFVAVSRAVGSQGSEIAGRLAERIGWPLFDKEILQHMADDDVVRARIYEKMDERDTGWLESMVRWLLQGEFRMDDYFHRLTETVLALARQGPAIFLGRGADFILPQDRGFRVRLFAPQSLRVQEYARQNQCDEKTAQAEIRRIEREREEFFQKNFGKAMTDPTRFDLLINIGRVSHEDAVDIIVAALKLRGVSIPAPSQPQSPMT